MTEPIAPIHRLRGAVQRIREETRDTAALGVRHDDADDETGTLGTDDAIGFDPFPMLALMQETRADYAVFGQVAGILHGSLELTGDLDILWDGSAATRDQMAAAFARAGVIVQGDDAVMAADYRAAFGGPKFLFEGLGCAGDRCTPELGWGPLDVTAFLARKIWAYGDSLAVPYVCLDDLIQMRRAVGRAKDARRAEELERLSDSHTAQAG